MQNLSGIYQVVFELSCMPIQKMFREKRV